MDGELVTTKLQNLNIGVEEFVEHSYYENWNDQRFETDPLGAPISPNHLWNKETKPRPTGQSWKDRYTWDTAPRWDRIPMEAECTTRMWTTAAAQLLPHTRFLDPTGESLRMVIPRAKMAESEMEWRIPQDWNAFERNRGRAYCIPYTAMVAMDNWTIAMDLLKKGDTRIHTPFETPKRGMQIGAGFWGAAT